MMKGGKANVRVLVMGDPGVGKSSIINCFISNNFEENLAPVIPPAILPAEVTESCPLTIVDTPGTPDMSLLDEELRRADVVLLIYAVDKPSSLPRVSSHWLPLIKSKSTNIPVVVVGNKVDMRVGDSSRIENDLRDAAAPIMEMFREVETCIECSAKKMINISELFLFASKAVLHPTAPLYDTKHHELRPPCARALRRIFKICDADCDGALSDNELNRFQEKCFGTPLMPRQLRGVKDVIRRNVQDGVNDVGVSVSGFLYLHTLFIQRGRCETTWKCLRSFGYGADLRIQEDGLPALPRQHQDQSCELSDAGMDFLRKTFAKHDKDSDGRLTDSDLDVLFECAPSWLWCPDGVSSGSGVGMTEDSFLSLWTADSSSACYLRPKMCMEFLLYLGCAGVVEPAPAALLSPTGVGDAHRGTVAPAMRITPRRSIDWRKKTTSRTVFEVLLCCDHAMDPTAVEAELLSKVPHFTAQGMDRAMEILKGKPQAAPDVVVLVYDANVAHSFAGVAEMRACMTKHKHVAPCILAALNRGGGKMAQQLLDGTPCQPIDFCNQNSLIPPLVISISHSGAAPSLDQLFAAAGRLCLHPQEGSPTLAAQQRQAVVLGKVQRYTGYMLLLACVGAVGFVSFQKWKRA